MTTLVVAVIATLGAVVAVPIVLAALLAPARALAERLDSPRLPRSLPRESRVD